MVQSLINLDHYYLWDFAGVDGLQFARELVGDRVTRIARFQSLEVSLGGYSGSILRLCEGNFRLGLQGDAAAIAEMLRQHQAQRQVWVKPCDKMRAIALPESTGIELLPRIMTTKPPHRLQGLQPNCAVPARYQGTAVLVWRHSIGVELHLALKDVAIVKSRLAEAV